MSDPTTVFPVPGVMIPGESHTEREVESKKEADRLVKTGAFALSRADAVEASPWSPEAIKEVEDAAAAAAAPPEAIPPEADSSAEPVPAAEQLGEAE